MTKFDEQFAGYIQSIELLLPELLLCPDDAQNRVAEAMKYSLLSGGKRIRAVLLTACYTLFEKDFRPAIPFAAAIEMIHAYSLIHDDLPCMDDDDMRRGKPSCHIAYGEAVALLAGDGLLTLAFETLARPENEKYFGAEKTLDAVRILAKAAGAGGMVGGQMLDLENENHEISLETLMLTDAKKTGALIISACEIGCVLGGADEKTTEHIRNFASKLGLAFQIQDDILDVTGEKQKLGKPIGSDSENNKATYASLFGIAEAGKMVRKLTDEANSALESTGLDVEFLCALANMLVGRKH